METITRTKIVDVRLDLYILTLSQRFNQFTVHTDTSTGRNRFKVFFTQFFHIHNDLNIIDCRTVIQRDKANLFTTTTGTNPSLHVSLNSYVK